MCICMCVYVFFVFVLKNSQASSHIQLSEALLFASPNSINSNGSFSSQNNGISVNRVRIYVQISISQLAYGLNALLEVGTITKITFTTTTIFMAIGETISLSHTHGQGYNRMISRLIAHLKMPADYWIYA